MLAVHDSGRSRGWQFGHLLGGRFFGERVDQLTKLAAFALFARQGQEVLANRIGTPPRSNHGVWAFATP